MITHYLFVFLFIIPLCLSSNAVPTKLCANEECTEALFETTAVRPYAATHEEFLTLQENETIYIYSIKMSNRPDIIEGQKADGTRGLLYLNFVDKLSYVFYLLKVVEDNVEMYEVKQFTSIGEQKLVRKRPANPFLWRDYEVQRKQQEVVFKELAMLPDPDEKKKTGHGHHHHNHDHSHHNHDHSHGHDHSHDHDHGHAHVHKPTAEEKPAALPEAPKVAETPQIVTPPTPPPVTQQPIDPVPKTVLTEENNNFNPPPPEERLPVDTISRPPPIAEEHPVDVQKREALDEVHVQPTAEELKQPVATPVPVTPPAPVTPPNDVLQDQNVVKDVPVEQLKPVAAPAPTIVPPSSDPVLRKIMEEKGAFKPLIPPIQQPKPVEVPTVTTPPPPVEPVVQNNLVQDNIPPPLAVEEQKPADVPVVTISSPPEVEIQVETIPRSSLFDENNNLRAAPVFEEQKEAETPSTTQPTPIDVVLTEEKDGFHVEAPLEVPKPIETPVVTTTPTPAAFEEHPADPNQMPKSALLDEKEDLKAVADLMDGYCTTDDCKDYSAPAPKDGIFAKTIKPFARSVASSIKSVTPYPVNQFDDTGVFVLLFFIFTFVLYLFNWLFQDGGKKDIVDRRALHDALSRIKEQEIMLQKLKRDSADPQAVASYIGKINQGIEDYNNLKQEYDKLFHAHQQREADYTEVVQDNDRLSNKCGQLDSEKLAIKNEYENVVSQNKGLTEELHLVRGQLSEAVDRQTDAVSELQQSRKRVDELEHELREAKSDQSNLKLKVDSLNEKIEDLEKQVLDLKNLEEQYIDAIAELKNKQQEVAAAPKVESVGSGESNASNGWSDMDMADLDAPEEKAGKTGVSAAVTTETEQVAKKPVKVAALGKKNKKEKEKEKEPSPEQHRKMSTASGAGGFADLMELVVLKKELKSMEASRDELKRDLHTEKRSKELVERELDEIKRTLSEKRAELERIAIDKDYFKSQSETLSQKLDDATHKLDKVQTDKERLLADKEELQKKLFELEAERRDSLSKIKELEKLLNRAEDDNKKVETQLFSEQRKLGQHIHKLEAELQKYRLATSLNEGVGSGNSSDRDFSFPGATNGGDEVRGLWADVDVETSFDEGLVPQDRRRSRGLYGQPEGRRSVGRREAPQPPVNRRRSRSAGRNRNSQVSSPNNYIGSTSPLNHYERNDEHRRSSKRLSRSGQLNQSIYYSSDGSNGLSPPPQMPPKSGVPLISGRLLHRPAPK